MVNTDFCSLKLLTFLVLNILLLLVVVVVYVVVVS